MKWQIVSPALVLSAETFADWYTLADPDQSDWSEKRKFTSASFDAPSVSVIQLAEPDPALPTTG